MERPRVVSRRRETTCEKKLEVFKKLTTRYHVVMIQEMHGNLVEVKHVFRHLARTHWICVSAGPDSATGGVTTFVQKAKFSNHYLEKVFEVPGRVLGVRIRSRAEPESELVLINVHDESLSPPDKRKIEKYIKRRPLARRAPRQRQERVHRWRL